MGVCFKAEITIMKLPDIRINKRIYVWSESMSCKRVSNWNYKVTDMLNILEMHRFVDPNIHINISTKLFQIKCTKFFTDQWNKIVNKESAKRGIGGSKLRTYRLFKQRYETELYATNIYNKGHKSALAKFRLETGRYKGLSIEERLCQVCDMHVVEDEKHVLLECPLYTPTRDILF